MLCTCSNVLCNHNTEYLVIPPGFRLTVEAEGCGFGVNSDLSGELGTRGALALQERIV